MENLYVNIGSKLKGVAVTTFILESIAAVISGIALFANDNGLLGFAVIVGGAITALILSWFIYGFGELIDKATENEMNTKTIVELLKGGASTTPAVQQQQAPISASRTAAAAPIMSKEDCSDAEPIAVTAQDDKVVCPKCGTQQLACRKVCWSCGQKFTN